MAKKLKYNKTRLADVLGISRPTLRVRLEQAGLDPQLKITVHNFEEIYNILRKPLEDQQALDLKTRKDAIPTAFNLDYKNFESLPYLTGEDSPVAKMYNNLIVEYHENQMVLDYFKAKIKNAADEAEQERALLGLNRTQSTQLKINKQLIELQKELLKDVEIIDEFEEF